MARARSSGDSLTRQLYTAARVEGQGGESWLVLADRLQETGYAHLGRRLKRAVYAWRRLPVVPRATPSEVSARARRSLRREWRSMRGQLDGLTDRLITAREKKSVQNLAVAFLRAHGNGEPHRAFDLARRMDIVGWPNDPNVIPTGSEGPPQRWRVQTLDVWGNADDGYEINEWFDVGTVEAPTNWYLYNVNAYRDNALDGYRPSIGGTIQSEASINQEALERAVRREYLRPGANVRFETDGSGDIVEVLRSGGPEDGMPILQLTRIDDLDDEDP